MDNSQIPASQQVPAGRPSLSAPPNSTGQAFGAQRLPGASGQMPVDRAPGREPTTRGAVSADEQASAADHALELACQIARELAFLDGTAAADLDGGDLVAFVTTAEQMIARHSSFARAYRTFLAASLNQSGRMPGTLYTPPRFTDDLARGDRGSW